MRLGCDIGDAYAFISGIQSGESDAVCLMGPDLPLGMPTGVCVVPPGNSFAVWDPETDQSASFWLCQGNVVPMIRTKLRERTVRVGKCPAVPTDRMYTAVAGSAVEIAQRQLRKLQEEKGLPSAPAYQIVFAYPAAYQNCPDILNRMQNALETVVVEGRHLEVIGRLPEPAAAAIACVHDGLGKSWQGIRSIPKGYTAVVLDFGYAAFDLAAVRFGGEDAPFRLLAAEEDSQLGGKDYDRVLADALLQQFQDKGGRIRSRQRNGIEHLAVQMKMDLSTKTEAAGNVALEDSGQIMELSVTREDFENMSQSLTERAAKRTAHFLQTLSQRGERVDEIILTGGTSQIPVFRKRIQETADSPELADLHLLRVQEPRRPSAAVSLGAAYFAAEQVQQPLQNCYGFETIGSGHRHVVAFTVPCGKKLPAIGSLFPVPAELSGCDRLTLRVYRQKRKGGKEKEAPVEECESISWFTFDVEPGVKYRALLAVREDGGVEVTLFGEDGSVQIRSTAGNPIHGGRKKA